MTFLLRFALLRSGDLGEVGVCSVFKLGLSCLVGSGRFPFPLVDGAFEVSDDLLLGVSFEWCWGRRLF